MHPAVAGNEPGIGLVRFGPGQLGFAKGMDLGRVDHADQELLLRQETRQIPSIRAISDLSDAHHFASQASNGHACR